MPEVDARRSPAAWDLTEGGQGAARALRAAIPEGVVVLSSSERKAVRTAQLATGRDPQQDPRFGEVIRPGEPHDEDVRARRAAWVRGEPDARHRGWESPSSAALRFGAALHEQKTEELLIATHGMVLVAWLVSIGQVRPGAEAERFWTDLAFPDLLSIDLGRDDA